ncbi:anti-sigma factor antagonist [Porcipelethomonas sp.]|uniref:anti-sigma factor antagonist n=1 Tax=Porcipelethomonas sp. TaxID=2981675 RepID=UPI003EF3D4FE
MSVRIINEENKVTAILSGEIDHHIAGNLRRDIDFAIHENQPSELILDFADVGFMDSSGIGLVMGRYKLMQEIGGTVTIKNPQNHIKKVMRLSGIDKLTSICNV